MRDKKGGDIHSKDRGIVLKRTSCTVRALFDSTEQHRNILPAFEAAALRARPRRRAEVVLCARVGAARDEEPH